MNPSVEGAVLAPGMQLVLSEGRRREVHGGAHSLRGWVAGTQALAQPVRVCDCRIRGASSKCGGLFWELRGREEPRSRICVVLSGGLLGVEIRHQSTHKALRQGAQ